VVQALEDGATFEEAAEKAGCGISTLHHWRNRSPAFGEACRKAVEISAAPLLVTSGKNRKYRLVRGRRNRFGRERKAAFIAHFSATCDAKAAARVAGVSVECVYVHRAKDPVFAADWQEALLQGYARLEAEGLRIAEAAMRRLEVVADEDAVPDLEDPAAFDRAMALLREHKRSLAGVGRRVEPALTRWDFDKSLAALEKALDAYRARRKAEGGGDA
jgi:hypothetical protein